MLDRGRVEHRVYTTQEEKFGASAWVVWRAPTATRVRAVWWLCVSPSAGGPHLTFASSRLALPHPESVGLIALGVIVQEAFVMRQPASSGAGVKSS